MPPLGFLVSDVTFCTFTEGCVIATVDATPELLHCNAFNTILL